MARLYKQGNDNYSPYQGTFFITLLITTHEPSKVGGLTGSGDFLGLRGCWGLDQFVLGFRVYGLGFRVFRTWARFSFGALGFVSAGLSAALTLDH